MKVSVEKRSVPTVTSPLGVGGSQPVPDLGTLPDVDPTDLDDGDVLVWDAGSGTWVAVDPATFGGVGSSIVYNVKDYGAVGDDTTDDIAAIQDAYDASDADGGGIIYFPKGSYKITSPILVNGTGMTRFVGTGEHENGSVIRQATANTNGFTINSSAGLSHFEHLHVKGPTGNSSGAGISGYSRTTSVRVSGFYNGLSIPNTAHYSKHVGSWFYDNDNAGVIHASGGNNSSFINCYNTTNAIGYDFPGQLSAKIIGGEIELNTTAGIRANGGGTNGAGLIVEGVYFEHADGVPDILLGNSSQLVGASIVGNTFVKSLLSGTGWAVDGQNVVGLYVAGNEIDSSDAIRATGSSGPATVIGNKRRNDGTVTIPSGSWFLDPDESPGTPQPIGSAAVGTDAQPARSNHVHAADAADITFTPGSGISATDVQAAIEEAASMGGSGTGELLISSTPSTPLVFDDILQNSDGTDFVYSS